MKRLFIIVFMFLLIACESPLEPKLELKYQFRYFCKVGENPVPTITINTNDYVFVKQDGIYLKEIPTHKNSFFLLTNNGTINIIYKNKEYSIKFRASDFIY